MFTAVDCVIWGALGLIIGIFIGILIIVIILTKED